MKLQLSKKHEEAVDVHAVNSRGQTALHRAADRGDAAQVRKLVEAGSDVNARDKSGNTPLHLGSARDKETVETLLAGGANPNAVNSFGYRPVHNAADNGRGDIINRLAEAGATLTARGPHGESVQSLLTDHHQRVTYAAEAVTQNEIRWAETRRAEAEVAAAAKAAAEAAALKTESPVEVSAALDRQAPMQAAEAKPSPFAARRDEAIVRNTAQAAQKTAAPPQTQNWLAGARAQIAASREAIAQPQKQLQQPDLGAKNG